MRDLPLFAASVFCCFVLDFPAHGAFYTPENLPQKPAGLENALHSTPRLKSVGIETDCAGAVISNDGYLLTALHCLVNCLMDYQIEPVVGFQMSQSGTLYQTYQVRVQKPENVKCVPFSMVLPNSDDKPAYFAKDPKLIWTGKGAGRVRASDIDKLTPEQFELLKNKADDYAILKFEAAAPLTCIPAAEKEPAPDEPVWAIGYPGFTERGDGFDSVGQKRSHISFGKVRGSLRDDPYIAPLLTTPLHWERQLLLRHQPHFLMTNMDLFTGTSGGPILDAKGNLVGTASSTLVGDTKKFHNATSFGIRISHIKSEMRKALGDEQVKQIFNCQPLP